MYISQETPQQTATRLQQVLAEAEFVLLPEAYAFVEVAVSEFPAAHVSRALAFVRDENVWSALVPATSPEQEQFVVFSFHFTPGLDNSGFVGWLASHFKSVVGTGVMVVCGQNSSRGGIFDYWGAPISVARDVVAEVHRLRAIGGASTK